LPCRMSVIPQPIIFRLNTAITSRNVPNNTGPMNEPGSYFCMLPALTASPMSATSLFLHRTTNCHQDLLNLNYPISGYYSLSLARFQARCRQSAHEVFQRDRYRHRRRLQPYILCELHDHHSLLQYTPLLTTNSLRPP
jgi:hypothetical protein